MTDRTKSLLIIAGIIILIIALIGFGFALREWTQDVSVNSDTTHHSGVTYVQVGKARLDSVVHANAELKMKIKADSTERRRIRRYYDSLLTLAETAGPDSIFIPTWTLDTLLDRAVRVNDSVIYLKDTVHAMFVGPPENYFTDVWVALADTPIRTDTVWITVSETIHEGPSFLDIGKYVLIGAGVGVLAVEIVNHLPGQR